MINDRAYEMPTTGQERARQPVLGGVLDRRLGVSDKQSACTTCGLRMQDCPGHFGFVKLHVRDTYVYRPSLMETRPSPTQSRLSLMQTQAVSVASTPGLRRSYAHL